MAAYPWFGNFTDKGTLLTFEWGGGAPLSNLILKKKTGLNV